jgi:hypothetical protein
MSEPPAVKGNHLGPSNNSEMSEAEPGMAEPVTAAAAALSTGEHLCEFGSATFVPAAGILTILTGFVSDRHRRATAAAELPVAPGSTDLPTDEGQYQSFEIERLIARRAFRRRGRVVKQYLVRWLEYGSEYDTWYNVKDLEDARDLVRDFEHHRRQEQQAKVTLGRLGRPKRKWHRRPDELPTRLSSVSVVKAATRQRARVL